MKIRRKILKRVREGEVGDAMFNWDLCHRHFRLIGPCERHSTETWYFRFRWPWYAWRSRISGNWLIRIRKRGDLEGYYI